MWLQLVYGCLPSLSDGETVFRHACKLDLERHCLEAEGLGLLLRTLAGLAQDEEPDCTSGQARGGRGLGQMTRTHSLPCERSGENRPRGQGIRSPCRRYRRIDEHGAARGTSSRPPPAVGGSHLQTLKTGIKVVLRVLKVFKEVRRPS
jgi:hypothetical protein